VVLDSLLLLNGISLDTRSILAMDLPKSQSRGFGGLPGASEGGDWRAESSLALSLSLLSKYIF